MTTLNEASALATAFLDLLELHGGTIVSLELKVSNPGELGQQQQRLVPAPEHK